MPKNKKYDLIVVGTGFASSFFLKKYLEKSTPEKKVLVLERGRLFPFYDRLRQRKGDHVEYVNLLKRHDELIENSNEKKPWVFDPNFGGSSNCWWGATLRFMPNDFKMKSLYNIGFDWPIGYDELESYYSEAEVIMTISGPEITPFRRSIKYPLPPHSLSTVDRLMQNHFGEELYFSQPTARASHATGNRGMCCSGYTCSVCPVNAKFTVENTLGHLYEDPRVELIYNAQVYQLLLQGDQAKKVIVKTETEEIEIEGNIIALGANAIFNAHILLASGDDNPSTGRYLSEQYGLFANVFLNDFNNLGGGSALTANGYSLYDGAFRSKQASCMLESHNGPFIRNEVGKWRQLARFKFVFEDLPNEKNRVILSDNPLKPRIEYERHSDYTERGKAHLLNSLRDVFKPLPVENIFADDYFQETEYHILGTAKMGKNNSDSVVDSNLIHHRYRNLFVLGGSAFPTITAANPSLTISALSLRSANLSF
jgi:choline dehydrogenase-like flavoprotein